MKPALPLRLLLAAGLFVISASFIVNHYTAMPDAAQGLLMGIGLGLMILSLMDKFKAKQV